MVYWDVVEGEVNIFWKIITYIILAVLLYATHSNVTALLIILGIVLMLWIYFDIKKMISALSRRDK